MVEKRLVINVGTVSIIFVAWSVLAEDNSRNYNEKQYKEYHKNSDMIFHIH